MRAVPSNRYVVFLLLVVVGCLVDLATKRWVFGWLGLHGEYWIWKGVFALQTSLNEGALFGMGQGMVWLFATLSILAALGIVYWLFVAGAARDLFLTVALGLVTAGILGNLYDRLGFGLQFDGRPIHAVRDWILVLIFGYHWPNFNVADSMLVCGACLIVWHAFYQDLSVRKATGDD
jgi:signal peptidase II